QHAGIQLRPVFDLDSWQSQCGVDVAPLTVWRRAVGKARAWLGDDAEHFKECHHRWLQESNRFRKWDTPEYRDEWAAEQCGACRYFIHLTGAFIEDWGVCSNRSSPLDGTATFEHDGCDQLAFAADGWGGPHRSCDHRRGHH